MRERRKRKLVFGAEFVEGLRDLRVGDADPGVDLARSRPT